MKNEDLVINVTTQIVANEVLKVKLARLQNMKPMQFCTYIIKNCRMYFTKEYYFNILSVHFLKHWQGTSRFPFQKHIDWQIHPYRNLSVLNIVFIL